MEMIEQFNTVQFYYKDGIYFVKNRKGEVKPFGVRIVEAREYYEREKFGLNDETDNSND
jgi:hypothetical protein